MIPKFQGLTTCLVRTAGVEDRCFKFVAPLSLLWKFSLENGGNLSDSCQQKVGFLP